MSMCLNVHRGGQRVLMEKNKKETCARTAQGTWSHDQQPHTSPSLSKVPYNGPV